MVIAVLSSRLPASVQLVLYGFSIYGLSRHIWSRNEIESEFHKICPQKDKAEYNACLEQHTIESSQAFTAKLRDKSREYQAINEEIEKDLRSRIEILEREAAHLTGKKLEANRYAVAIFKETLEQMRRTAAQPSRH